MTIDNNNYNNRLASSIVSSINNVGGVDGSWCNSSCSYCT